MAYPTPPNPFEPAAEIADQPGAVSESARLDKKFFLYREIDFEQPLVAKFVYTGWWFRQAIYFDQTPVWFRISWTKIHTELAFQLPPSIDPLQRLGQVEIEFTRGLMIRRFRIWFDAKIVYDEIH